MRLSVLAIASLFFALSALGGSNDRKFPSACIVFADPHETSRSVCAGGLDISGNLACGHRDSDQMTEISWRFLYPTAVGDVYRVSRRVRAKDARPLEAEPLETREVVYSGARLILFTAEYTVTIQPDLPKET